MVDQKKKSAFERPVVFSSNDPNQALGMSGVTVAIKIGGSDGMTIEQIKELQAKIKAEGLDIELALWQDVADQSILDASAATGINSIILQSEGPSQLQAASAISKEAQAQGLSVAVVTNFDGIGPGEWNDYFGPNVIAMPEAYANANPNATPENMMFRAQQVGANSVIITLGTYDATSEGGKVVPLADYLAQLEKMGITNFAAFSIEAMSPEDRKTFLEWLAKYPSAENVGTPKPAPPEIPVAPPSSNNEDDTTTNTNHTPSKPPATGINGPHQEAGSHGAPAPYTGGAPVVDNPNNPNDTFSFTAKKGKNKGKRVTITMTSSGAVIEQVEGQTPYQIKAPDKRPYDPTKPAWHQHPGWSNPEDGLVKGANLPSGVNVLEQRPGANGRVVLRLDNGTYVSVDPANPNATPNFAGTWNQSEWESTNHGATLPPSSASEQYSTNPPIPAVPGITTPGDEDLPEAYQFEDPFGGLTPGPTASDKFHYRYE